MAPKIALRPGLILLLLAAGCSLEGLGIGGTGAVAVTVKVTTASVSRCVEVVVTPVSGASLTTGKLPYEGEDLKVAVYQGNGLTGPITLHALGYEFCDRGAFTERSPTVSADFPWSGTQEITLTVGPTPVAGDADGDGYFTGDGPNADCDDFDRSVYPGARENCSIAVDTNCDGIKGCATGDTCVVDTCQPKNCPRLACPENAYCVDDERCEDAACKDFLCAAGLACARGTCAPVGCDAGTCSEGRVCENDRCVESACFGVQCPTGERCVRGACSPCPPGAYPDGGTCIPEAPAGTPCDSPRTCASGVCSDGVCCNRACVGTCEYCALDGGAGTCRTVPAGEDPLEQCGALDCSGVTPACLSLCALDSDCNTTHWCDAGTCDLRTGPGLGCTEDRTCLTNHCADDVCCDTACSGTCEACNLPGGLGTCSPLVAQTDPLDECPGQLTCNGQRGCFTGLGALCTADSECQTGFCVDGVCCNGGCDGPCEACNLGIDRGTCRPIPTHADPSDECAGPLSCNGTGACHRPDGAACNGGADCESGFCVDDVCCGTACAGTCEACNVAGKTGTCAYVPPSTDPKNECSGSLTCNGNGSCFRGEGAACTVSAECQSGFCVDGVCCGSKCDGTCEACDVPGAEGTCSPVPVLEDPAGECAPYFCSGDRGLCAAACSLDGDCRGDHACVLGECLPRRVQGAACDQDRLCQGGFCVDGVCCNTACNATCQACNVPNFAGQCIPSPDKSDFGGDCGAFQCNGAGACYGLCTTSADCKATAYCTGPPNRACVPKSPLGASCTQDGTCLSGFCRDGVCCDGGCSGTCRACNVAGKEGSCTSHTRLTDPGSECGGGFCDGAGACLAACTADSDCKTGSYCSAGACLPRKTPGTACTAANQCLSGFCTDGVCCNVACNGTCQACDLVGSVGTCASMPVNTDPAPECGLLQCSGSAACYTTCGADSHCKDGLYCSSGTCTPKKQAATSCSAANQCLSGFCADDVCCDSTCTGTCRACNVAGSVGSCTNVPAYQDPASECAGDTTCSGAAACFKARGIGCSINGECQSNACADGVCCNTGCAGDCQSCNLIGTEGTCTNAAAQTDPSGDCGVYTCSGVSASCLGTCSSDEDCKSGSYCKATACVPAAVPSAPTGVSVTSNVNGQLPVSWTAPAANGSAITGYRATATPSVGSARSCDAVAPVTTCTISAVVNGVAYAVTVAATNGVGQGLSSAPSVNGTPATTPGAPTGVTVQSNQDGQLPVSWTAPTNTGGSPLTGYVATATASGQTQRTCTSTGTSCTLTGITHGVVYTVTVKAINALGNSSASGAATGTASTTPDAPTGVSVTSNQNGSLPVSWSSPANNGGAAITGFTATATAAGQTTRTCTTTLPNTSCSIGSVVNGVTYAVTVTATNASGTSAASSPVSGTPSTVPGAPTSVIVTSNVDSQLPVSWSAPSSNGGASITLYTATATASGQPTRTCTATPPTTTCTLTGVTNGSTYSVTVTATNVAGNSAASSAGTGTPATLPGAPTGVSVTSNQNQQLSVGWSAPASNGGSAITSYTATATASGQSSRSCTSAGTTCVISSVVNGITYAVTVTATNALGTSTASTPSANGTPAAVPDSPTGVTVTSNLDAQLPVSWSAPANNGAAITLYTATATASGQTTRTCTATPPNTTCTIGSVVNGVQYAVTVTAANAAGTSSVSSPSVTGLPATAPGVPAGLSVTSNQDGQLPASWSTLTNTGGLSLTAYTVTATATGQTTLTCTATPPSTSCTLSPAVNGVTYSVKVRAANAIGTGSDSTAVNGTPSTVPGAPTGLTVTSLQNLALPASWTAPASNGGATLTTYTVTATAAGQTTQTCTVTHPATTCTVGSVVNGVTYSVTVTAANASGTGAASTPASGTPASSPAAPTSVSASSGNDRQVPVSWTVPTSDGGSPLTGYTATATAAGQTSRSCTASPGTTSCTIPSVVNGVSYSVSVVATNAVGTSAPSVPAVSATPAAVPSAPSSVSVTSNQNGQLPVSWSAPASNGSSLTGYVATAAATGETTRTCSANGSTTNCTIGSLVNGVTYSVTVTATNAVGTSSASSPGVSGTPAAVPDAPTGVTVISAQDVTLPVSWTAPATNGSAITLYTATATANAQITRTCTATPPATNCTIGLVVNGVQYSVSVVATNAAGNSAASAPAVTGMPATLPSAPTGVTVTSNLDGQLPVSWTAPTSTGGPALVGYTATATASGQTSASCIAPAGTTTCTIGSLLNGISYTVTVTASTSVGTSAASSPATGKPATAPGAPTGVTVTSFQNGQLPVSWTAPAAQGGASVSSYTATASAAGQTTQTCSSATTSCTILQLTNGVSYSVTVTATNAAGTGVASTSASGTAATTPEPPTNVLVTSNQSGKLPVSWTGSTQDGGAPITQYTATASAGGQPSQSCTVTPPAPNTCEITGLTNGITYSVSVTATNAAGTGTGGTGNGKPLGALGDTCSGGTACNSTFCADGVCCNSACNGALCEACHIAGSVGTCTAVPAGTDPYNECSGGGGNNCNGLGGSGGGGCQ